MLTDWLLPTLGLLSQPIPPQSTIGAKRDMPRPLSNEATLPQRGSKRKHLTSGGTNQRNAVADIQKPTREPETARADHEARKGDDGSDPHQGSPNQVLTCLHTPPDYEGRKHLVKRMGNLREERALWVRMLLEMGGG